MKKAIVYWKSKVTGLVSHGEPISLEAAQYAAKAGDRKWRELTHWVVSA